MVGRYVGMHACVCVYVCMHACMCGCVRVYAYEEAEPWFLVVAQYFGEKAPARKFFSHHNVTT